MIIDSSFVIDLQNSHEGAVMKLSELDDADSSLRVPGIVVSEVFIGVGKGSQTEQNRERLERVLSELDSADCTIEVLKKAGIIEGEVQRARESDGESDESGEGIGLPDAIIAATAAEYDEAVLTADPNDFENATVEIEVEEYR